jgi:hypothetical protein
MAVVVIIWSTLATADGISAKLTKESFAVLAKFIDYKQVGIPIAGGFLLYLLISILSFRLQPPQPVPSKCLIS